MNVINSTNPAKNYKLLGRVKISSKTEISRKVTLARKAQKEWKALGVIGRIKLLRKLAVKFSKQQNDLALLITREMGMPITQSKQEVIDGLKYFNWYLDNAKKYLQPEILKEQNRIIHQVLFEPIGVAAVIVPWNFPFSNFVWDAGQNLIVGNTVVFKHSEETPLSGKLIEEIISISELPEGVFSEVYGDGKVGDLLVHENIDLICFTGSTKIGKYLYQIAADKLIKIVMELGGSAPGIVFRNADIDSVLESLYFVRFINCGQACDALKRLIVHESRFNEVVEKLQKKLNYLKIGDPEDEKTDIGPLVAKHQLELLEEQVRDALQKGAKIVIGGKRPRGLTGAFYEPTLLTGVTQNMKVWQEEVFGPVLPIVSFKTETEAIKLANDTKYGLGAYIYTNDRGLAKRVAEMIDSGMVAINNANYLLPHNPFGGYKESGIGREHGKFGFHELCQIKVLSIRK